MAQNAIPFKIIVLARQLRSEIFDWVLSQGFLRTPETIEVQLKRDIGAIP